MGDGSGPYSSGRFWNSIHHPFIRVLAASEGLSSRSSRPAPLGRLANAQCGVRTLAAVSEAVEDALRASPLRSEVSCPASASQRASPQRASGAGSRSDPVTAASVVSIAVDDAGEKRAHERADLGSPPRSRNGASDSRGMGCWPGEAGDRRAVFTQPVEGGGGALGAPRLGVSPRGP